MGLILTPVADRPECARALKTSFQLGERLGASVKGTHIRPHRSSTVSLSADFAEAAWLKKSSKTAPAAAKELFKSVAQSHGFELKRRAQKDACALWNERVGSPEKILGIDGPVSDFVVLSRPAKAGGVADLFLRAALFEATSPIVLLPPQGRRTVGKRVLIAWNQSKEVARAVKSAMPILKTADEVTIVTCGGEDRPGPKASQLASYLAHHGVRAMRIETKGRKIESELMDTAQEIQADLLVFGAYSRSRWRQIVFGGTSEFLIYDAKLPVLTVHH